MQNALPDYELKDEPPVYIRSEEHRAYLEDKALEALEAENAAEEEDDDEDEDEEGGDEEAEGEDDYGDEDYGEEDPNQPDYAFEYHQNPRQDDPYFQKGERVRSRFNEHEVDAFMKVIGMKPFADWKDETLTHMWGGLHDYEDEHQETDPYFHIFGEIQRPGAEELITREWRRGAEVRFELNDKKPFRREYRF